MPQRPSGGNGSGKLLAAQGEQQKSQNTWKHRSPPGQNRLPAHRGTSTVPLMIAAQAPLIFSSSQHRCNLQSPDLAGLAAESMIVLNPQLASAS